MIFSFDCPSIGKSSQRGIKMEEFDVITKWVQVEVTIPASDAGYLAAQTAFIISRYGDDVFQFALKACVVLDSLQEGACNEADAAIRIREQIGMPHLVHSSYQGRKLEKISVSLEKWKWQSVERVAVYFECSPSAIIRAGLAERARKLTAFHKREKEEA